MLTAISSREKVVTAAVGMTTSLKVSMAVWTSAGCPDGAAAGDVEVAERDRGHGGDEHRADRHDDAVVDHDGMWAAAISGMVQRTAVRNGRPVLSRRKAKPRQTISSASPWKAKIPSRIHGQFGTSWMRHRSRPRQRIDQQDEDGDRQRHDRRRGGWDGRDRGARRQRGPRSCRGRSRRHGRAARPHHDRQPPTPGGVDLAESRRERPTAPRTRSGTASQDRPVDLAVEGRASGHHDRLPDRLTIKHHA